MFRTACHYVCVWRRAHYQVHNSLSLCMYVVEGTLPCSQQSVTMCVCVCVCVVEGTLPCSQQPVTVCVCVVEGTLPCSKQPFKVCFCGGRHTTMFTTACD